MKSSFNKAILRSLIMISNAWCLIFLTSSLPCCSFVAYLFVSVKQFPGGFGVFLCKLSLFLAYLSISVSVLTLAIMTIDRYFAIVRPMNCPPKWIENIHNSHNITMFEMVIRFVLLYLVPLLTMAMFYSEIVLHLWKRKATGLHIDKNQKRIEKQKRWSQCLSPQRQFLPFAGF